MADKSIDQFIHDLVNSPGEMHTWIADWSKQPEVYVPADEQEQEKLDEE